MTKSENDLRIPLQTDDHVDICDTVQKICSKFPGKYWRDLEDKPSGGGFPSEFVQALTEAGILGAFVPESVGGNELPIAAVAAIVETIHASGCNAAALINQFVLTHILASSADEPLARTLLSGIADGSATVFSLVRGTPEGESFATEMVGGKIVLEGSCARVFAPLFSDYMLVAANVGVEEAIFLIDLREVPKAQVVIEPLRELTASNIANIELRGLEIGRESRIGKANANAAVFLAADVVRRILEAAAAIGDGRFFSRRGTKYANERVVFGKPIGSYQGIQFPLARAHVEVEAAAIGLRKATALFDAQHDASNASSIAQYLATEAAWNIADVAFTTHGGFAFAREYDIERKWRDVRSAKLHRVFAEGDLKMIAVDQLGFKEVGSERN